MNVLIVYDTKHGNTKKVAELIGEGLETVEENVVKIYRKPRRSVTPPILGTSTLK